jgi:pheromone shutdown protein TraB
MMNRSSMKLANVLMLISTIVLAKMSIITVSFDVMLFVMMLMHNHSLASCTRIILLSHYITLYRAWLFSLLPLKYCPEVHQRDMMEFLHAIDPSISI